MSWQGRILWHAGDPAGAEARLKDALAILEPLGATSALASTLARLADVYATLHVGTKAYHLAQQARDMAVSLGAVEIEAPANRVMGSVLAAGTDPTRGERLLHLAVEQAVAAGDAFEASVSRGRLVTAYVKAASGIPSARLAVFEGESPYPAVGDAESVAVAIDEFLGEGEEATPKGELPEGMAVILFADIVDSTSLTEQLGDAAFRARARELDTSLRSVIKEAGGTPVEGKVLGDGVLAVFTSARQAIDCALRCDAACEPLGLQLHLGVHAGDVIREENNVYGGAVNIAARIASAAAPGEVLVSETVRGLARTSAGVAFEDRGEHELKGVAEPQRLFAVKGGR